MMDKSHLLKEAVKQKYGEIVLLNKDASCCASSCCCNGGDAVMSEDYSNMDGYVADADLGLGCGLPTQFANIQKGDTVLDLGSGAGNDCFVEIGRAHV